MALSGFAKVNVVTSVLTLRFGAELKPSSCSSLREGFRTECQTDLQKNIDAAATHTEDLLLACERGRFFRSGVKSKLNLSCVL